MNESKFIIQNRLGREKRDLSIYHHLKKSAYMLSHSNSATIPLGTQNDGDYLHLSMVSGPGSQERDCWFDIPSWCSVEFSRLCNGGFAHRGERVIMKIPPGPPVWQVKITRPHDIPGDPDEIQIIISDIEPL